MKEPEVSEKFSISAEIYDDEATHGYRPLSCRRARIIKSLLFLVFLKTNAQNTSKKFLVETCGHIELRTMMIKYKFFFFMIPRAFPFLSLHILSYKAIIINAVSYWHIAKTQTCLHEHFIFVLLESLWKHFPLRGYTCSNENQNEWESLGYFKRKLLFWLNYFCYSDKTSEMCQT